MGITIPVYLNFVSFIRSFFQNFFQSRIMKNLKTSVFSAIVILIISFGGEAESKPMKPAQEGEILLKEGMEIDRRIKRDAQALSEEGTSLDQATEEGKSLDNAKDENLLEYKQDDCPWHCCGEICPFYCYPFYCGM